jgi:hypothetical protein
MKVRAVDPSRDRASMCAVWLAREHLTAEIDCPAEAAGAECFVGSILAGRRGHPAGSESGDK